MPRRGGRLLVKLNAAGDNADHSALHEHDFQRDASL